MKDDFSQDEKIPTNSNQIGNSSSINDDDSLDDNSEDDSSIDESDDDEHLPCALCEEIIRSKPGQKVCLDCLTVESTNRQYYGGTPDHCYVCTKRTTYGRLCEACYAERMGNYEW